MPIWLIQILVGIVLTVASQIISSIGKQDQQSQKIAGVRGTIQTGGDNAPTFIIGRYGTGGKLKYAGTWGNSGETPNAYYSKVIEVSYLPIRGFNGFFVNGERVTLAASATGDLGRAVLEYRVGGVDHLWIKSYTGGQTVADPLMRAKFGSDPDRPYTSTMVGYGLGYFVATALVNRELFPGLPEFMAEVDGLALDDPRGDNAHNNPIVAAYTILKGIYYDGQWVYGPQTYTDLNFRASNIESEADKCDVAVPLAGGGTMPRFRMGLEVALDAEPHAIVGELLKSCQGRWADLGGVYKFLVGEPGAPVVSITDEDMVITEQQTFEPFPGLESLFNGITATYPEPAEAWETKEAPPRYRSDLELLDDGRRLPFSTDYKAVPYAVQVQELMRAAIEETRRFRRHTQTMPPEWWEYEVLDVAEWTSERNGYEAKQFLITAMEDLPNANQFVGLQEIDATDYGWDSEYELPWDVVPLVIARPAPQITTGFSVAPYVVTDVGEIQRRPAIEVFWDGGLVDVRAVRIQVREAWDTKQLISDANIEYDIDDAAPSRVIANPAIVSAQVYEVRAIYLPFSGRITRWSNQDVDGTEGAWLSVTAPDVPEVTDIQVIQLGKELQNAHGLVTGNSAGSIQTQLALLKQREEELALAVMDFNATAKETLNVLFVQKDGAVAGIIRNEKAIVEEGLARATAITELTASIGNFIAGGFLRFDAEVNELGSSASITAKVKATAAAAFSQSAWVLQAEANGLGGTDSFFGVFAETFVVYNEEGGVAYPAFTLSGGEARFNTALIRNLTATNIAANSITVNELDVATLSAISANLGTVTAGTISLGSGKLVIDGANVRILVSD